MMTRGLTVLLGLWALACASLSQGVHAQVPPPWAYGFKGPPPLQADATASKPIEAAAQTAVAPADNQLKSLPGSELRFTLGQIRDRFGPADWFPGDHPKMPDVVAHGRKPDVIACALCHYPNGKGRPENAPIAGLPVTYFVEQMRNFRSGHRKSADARKSNTNLMIAAARAMTDEEIRLAAEYFGSLQWTPWITVLETEWVPKTQLSVGMFLPIKDGGQELLGERIIEVPQDVEAVEVLRNPRVGFIAYVPVGSVNRGGQLVNGSGEHTVACRTCHGADLNGTAAVPGIAGRSPSYLMRQMFDMKVGTRTGSGVQLMKPALANLDEQDMLAIAAYLASRDVAVKSH